MQTLVFVGGSDPIGLGFIVNLARASRTIAIYEYTS
jgi:hypothetical protein